jgi:hypothetical protein
MARAQGPPVSGAATLQERRLAVRLLLDAHDTARDSGRDVWEYACDLASFHEQHISDTTLRWLIFQGFAEHGVETTSPSSTRRRFTRVRNTRFTAASCFVLTDQGARHARDLEHERASEDEAAPDRPHYDPEGHALFLGGILVKHFTQDAPTQERVCAAFEEEGWPPVIDDPLQQDPRMAPEKRLNDTVYRLNHRQKNPLMVFGCLNRGQGVTWRRAT